MLVKTIVDEDFSNYKKPSMVIGCISCNFKCCKEANIPVSICQNEPIYLQPNIDISIDEIIDRYINNPISKTVVFGGLEPMLQFEDIILFLHKFRNVYHCNDDVVIYTGYYEYEIIGEIKTLQHYPNVIVKFGRFKPNEQKHYDETLGIELISSNQYAKKIS